MISAGGEAVEAGSHLVPMLGLREPVSALTHLVAAVASAAGLRALLARAGEDRPKRASLAIYGASLVVLFAVSGIFHAIDRPLETLEPLRALDHAAIFLVIAGSFTPFLVNAVDGWWRAGHLALIWTVALLGMGTSVSTIELPDSACAALYVGMGWLALLSYGRLAAVLSRKAMALTALGGAIYTLGAASYAAEWPVLVPGVFGCHEMLHVLVMAGSAVHFSVVMRFIVPLDRARRPAPPLPVPIAA